MENYVRAPKEKSTENVPENEVRIVASNHMKTYIAIAITLFNEKGHSKVVLRSMGRAINKTVAIAEVVKRRVAGLHQVTAVNSIDITDTWEPTEPGLNKLEIVRHVSVMSITLSKTAENETSPGYQAPLPADMVQPLELDADGNDPLATELEARAERNGGERRRGGRGSGRPRGPRGGGGGGGVGGEGGEGAVHGGDEPAGGPEGVRGRRRGGRGRGRGGRGGRGGGRGRVDGEGAGPGPGPVDQFAGLAI